MKSLIIIAVFLTLCTACGSNSSDSTEAETPNEDLRANSSDWRYVSGTGYEGMAIPTERFPTSIGAIGTKNPGPTDEEIAAFEALLQTEIKESGIETLPDFEGLSDRLGDFKRYYFSGINITKGLAFQPDEFPKPADQIHPALKAELDSERIILAELSTRAGKDWQTSYQLPESAGFIDYQFYALYLPDSGTFWLEFQVGGEIDNTFH